MDTSMNDQHAQALIEEAAPFWKEWPQIKGRPYPIVTEDGVPFWLRAKEGVLAIQRCRACSKHQMPPWSTCRNCMSVEVEWEKSGGKGSVYSFSVVHHPPYEGLVAPYAFAVIELDEGVRMATNVINCPMSDVKIGMRVRVVFKPISENITLPFFEPDF
jgi:uncharacterized OB-fold protein